MHEVIPRLGRWRGRDDELGILIGRPPIVELDYKVKTRMEAWVKMAPGEISGLGTLHEQWRDGQLFLRVDNLWLFEQECTGGSTVLKAMSIMKFMHAMTGKVRDEDQRFWWHSHKYHQSIWSGTDEATFDQLTKDGINYLAIVSNANNEYLARYIMKRPVEIAYDGIPIHTVHRDKTVVVDATKEFKGKITNLPKDFEVKVGESGEVETSKWDLGESGQEQDTEAETSEVE